MIRQLIHVAIPLVAAGSGFPDSSLYRNTHSNGFKFYTLFFLPVSSLACPPLQGTNSNFSLPLFPTLHSLCPWDTPFIYFLLNFSALQDSFPAVPGGTESTLGVSQRLAGVGTDARGAKLGVGLVWDGERGRDRHFGSALSSWNLLGWPLFSNREWPCKIYDKLLFWYCFPIKTLWRTVGILPNIYNHINQSLAKW